MKKYILAPLLSLLATLHLFSQEKPTQLINEKMSTIACEGPIVRFVDKGFNEVDHVQIARWEDSYTADGKVVPNFASVDKERFYLEVVYDDAVGDQLTILLESFKYGVDPTQPGTTADDNQVAVVLNRVGTSNLFRSIAKIVVTDLDKVDDNFDAPPPGVNEASDGVAPTADGTDDGSDDVTIFGMAEGKLRAKFEYGNLNKVAIVNIGDVNENDNETLLVKLRLLQIVDEISLVPYCPTDVITEQLLFAKSVWNQCNIRLVDNTLGDLDENDAAPPFAEPQNVALAGGTSYLNVDLSDGMWVWPQNNTNHSQRNEGFALRKGTQDADNTNIDVYFISFFVTDSNNDGILEELEDLRGLAYTSYHRNNHMRLCIFIPKTATIFALGHEIGHILMDRLGHIGSNEPQSYAPQSSLPINLNLLNSGISTGNGIRATKRLENEQCQEARTKTLLPIHQQ